MLLATSILFSALSAPPQEPPAQLLVPPGLVTYTHFGWDVDVDGPWAVVGAYAANANGAAHLFHFGPEGWRFFQTLSSPVPVGGGGFGFRVDLDGDTLAIGQPEHWHSPYQGHAFLFRWDGTAWVHSQTLTDPAPQFNDRFGADLSLDGDDLAVQTSRSVDPWTVRPGGQVWMYERLAPGTFARVNRLMAPTLADQTIFNVPAGLWFVHVEDGLLFVTEGNNSSGFVRTASRGLSGWDWQAEIVDASLLNTGAYFGHQVDRHGDQIAISLTYWNVSDPAPPGRVRIYEQDRVSGSWLHVQTLFSSTPQSTDRFGKALRFGEGGLVVGSELTDTTLPGTGSVHWFRPDEQGDLQEVASYTLFDQQFPYAGLGCALGVDFANGQVVAGAYGANLPGIGYTGTAHAFDLSEGSIVHPGLPCSTGAPVRLGVIRDAVDPAHPLTLTLHDVPAGASGVFLVGLGGPPTPVGGGLLVTGLPLWRIFPVWSRPAGGQVFLPLDAGQPALAGALLPGRTWVFQAWFRDPAAGASATHLSAARAVNFD